MRDQQQERDLVEAAAKTVRISIVENGTPRLVSPPTRELNDFADARAGGRPIRDEILDRGDREAKEEAADFRNYVAWRMLYRQNKPEALLLRGQALGHIVAAYHLISVAEEMEAE